MGMEQCRGTPPQQGQAPLTQSATPSLPTVRRGGGAVTTSSREEGGGNKRRVRPAAPQPANR